MSDDSSDGSSRTLLDRLVHVFGSEPNTLDDILELMRDAHTRSIIDADTLQMLEGVCQVVNMRVRDIMIPRAQMVVVERDMTLEELVEVIVESGHSRFPVIGEDKDDVVGVLLAKDVLKYNGLGDGATPPEFDVANVLRAAVITPESKRLNILLKEFRSDRNHMAIVLDEYGGVAGLVTIEDVLEQIVGDIDDEHDTDEDVNIRDHGNGQYSVRALTPIEEFNELLEAEFSDAEFDTIGGVIMTEFGHMPKPGESTVIDGFHFKVLVADSRRIHLVQVDRED